MIKNLLPVLYTTAGVAIVGAAGYAGLEYSGSFETDTPQVSTTGDAQQIVSLLPNSSTGSNDDALAATPNTQSDETAAAPTVEEAPLPAAPVFSLLRVETDGSTLIAGSGPANTDIALLIGGAEKSRTKTGIEGDFVIVLDEPLSPGLHEVQLKAILEDGTEIASAETGIIEVPEAQSGEQPTVLVSQAGEPTRVLQRPQTVSAETETQTTAPTIVDVQSDEIKADAPEETAANTDLAAADLATDAAAADAEPETEAKVTSDAEPVKEAAEETVSETADLTETETSQTQTAALAESDEPETAPAIDAASAQDTDTNAQEAQTAKPEAEKPEVEKVAVPVLIEAADVEDDQFFIAGTGQPNANVNIYFGNEFIGSAKVLPNGAFLFEGKKKVAPGSHDVRADMVEPDSFKVIARAEVTLLHDPEPGEEEAPATDAPAETVTAQVKPQAAQPETPVQEEVAEENAQPETKKLETIASNAATPEIKQQENQISAAPSNDVSENGEIEEKAVEAVTRKADPEKPKNETATQAANNETNAAGDQTGNTVAARASESVTISPVPTSEVAEEKTPEETETASADASQTQQKQQTAQNAEPVAQPQKPAKKIIRTGSAVIIRRGDNLWQVAQRNYGKGIRYTTIFKANAGQIRDPDLIYPGQVFKLPEDKQNGSSG